MKNMPRERLLQIDVLAAAVAVVLSTHAAHAEERQREEIPGGHFYIGLSAEGTQPFGRALISRDQLTAGSAGALYLHYEGERFLVSAEIARGHFGHDDTYSNPFLLAIRAGPVFGSGRYAPYLAVGVAQLAFGAIGDDAASARGLTAEAGVLLFRQLRWFRATAFLQCNLPIWGDAGKGVENVTSLSWAALGVRVEL